MEQEAIEKNDKVLNIRVTADMRAAFHAAARADQRTMGSWCRVVLLDAAKAITEDRPASRAKK